MKHPRCPRQANFMFTLIVKIADVGDRLGQYLQSRNASDSSDHVVKIADRLGRLGWGVHTGRRNPRRQKIVGTRLKGTLSPVTAVIGKFQCFIKVISFKTLLDYGIIHRWIKRSFSISFKLEFFSKLNWLFYHLL